MRPNKAERKVAPMITTAADRMEELSFSRRIRLLINQRLNMNIVYSR